jgi:glycosyltransferase involved in cell wall biosynthesis
MELQQQEMKIIIASPSLNLLGGAQRACLHAINALRKTNCKIVLVTIDKTDWALVEAIFGDASKPDEEMYLFSRMPEMPIVALKQAFVALSYALYLSVITAENRTGLVINMGGELVDNLGDVVYVNAIPLRLTHFPRGVQPRPGIQWKVYSRLFSMFLRFLGDATGVMVANSKFTQKVIRECLGKKALLINPPVESNKTLMHVNQGKRENVVITITRFRSAKGLEIIPEIASYVRDCEFVVVGIADKESKQCLKELSEKIERLGVQKRVHIFRNKPYGFTLSALSTAKIYLHTQSTEAFGMSIVESMAAGCIPIVPRTGGPWIDILDCQEGQYGFSYRSSAEAAAKIKLLLDDESLRSKVSVRAIERSMVFDSSAFEKKLLSIVEAVFSRSKRGSC